MDECFFELPDKEYKGPWGAKMLFGTTNPSLDELHKVAGPYYNMYDPYLSTQSSCFV